MAKLFIPFEVSLSGSAGNDRISINDPTFGQQDDLNNQRLQMLYNQQSPLSLEQQRLLQLLQNTGATGIYPNNMIVNPDPSVTPFPIGCPSGFFQEGNVCVPIIGTYPDENYNAPPAGNNFAKGVIDDIEGPNITKAGEQFEIRVFVRNTGAIRGKFQIGLVVPLWNIDVTSDSGWIPQYTPAIITVRGVVPAGATLGVGTIPATIELQGLDEVTHAFTIHDVSSLNLPQPQLVGQPPGTCFTQAGVQYCLSTTGGAGCVQIGSQWYCPTTVPPPACFTFNSIEYCETANPSGSGCITIGTKTYCPTTVPTPVPQCFTFNQLTYCESTEITGPNCVQIGTKIYCPTNAPPPPPNCITVGGVVLCKSTTWRTGCIFQDGQIYCPDVPPPPPNCITIGGAQFCQSTTWRTGCIINSGLIYCPEEEDEPEPPAPTPATIITSPLNSVPDGDRFHVKGFNFKPGERVDVTVRLVWEENCRSNRVRVRSYYSSLNPARAYSGSSKCMDGKVWTMSRYEIADSTGKFSEHFDSPEVDSGISGECVITAVGATSGKQATTIIQIT